MKRSVAGWLVLGFMVCGGLPLVHAAEQGEQSAKQQAMSTSATTTTAPMAASSMTTPHPEAAPSTPTGSSEQRSTPAAATTSPLEGTTWPVKVTPDAVAAQKGEKLFDDSLIFKDGKVTMSACVKMGFAPSVYATTPIGSTWSFTTRQVSTNQGTTRWMATFTGAAVQGTMIWTKQDGTVLRYTFEGQKTMKPGA